MMAQLAKPTAAPDAGHWFYSFFANDWHRSTKSNEQRMHEPFIFQLAGGRKVTLEQGLVKGEATLGLTVWDACLVLSKYMENEKVFLPGHFKSKRIVELGAGTGLCSLAAHFLGAEVTATDMNKEAVLAILRRNLTANGADEIKVVPHDWGTLVAPPLSAPYDYVLAADVIFKEELVPVLVKSMEALAGPQSVVYMCAENHSQKALDLFFELAAIRFEVQRVPLADMDETFQDDRIVIAKMRLKQVISPPCYMVTHP